jgi:hypothetical protein
VSTIIGARGTTALGPAQVPSGQTRSRKRTRRAQPYRRKHTRVPGPSLTAMLKGRPAFLPNPQDVKRDLLKKSKTKIYVQRAYAGRRRKNGRRF